MNHHTSASFEVKSDRLPKMKGNGESEVEVVESLYETST